MTGNCCTARDGHEKRRYLSKNEAKNALKMYGVRNGRVYECRQWPGLWHITYAVTSQETAFFRRVK